MPKAKLEVIIHPRVFNITVEESGISIEVVGYPSFDGGACIFIEGQDTTNVDGHPTIHIWSDINDQEPKRISLKDAHWTKEDDILWLNCPDCGEKRTVECVLGDGVISDSVTVHETWIEYHNETVQHGGTPRWQCLACGYVIQDENGDDITDEEELIEWLKNQ